jgi:hypothetical protein
MMATPSVDDRRPSADWGRAADGIQLAGFAVFLLLTTTGRLPWSFWIDAIALWPVLVMAAGLRMTVDRTRAPWLQLLAPALVLGALGWLATTQGRIVPVRDWKPVSLPRPEGIDSVHLEGRLVGARLDATSSALPAGTLADGRMASRRGTARLEAPVDGATASVRVQGPRRGGPFLWMPGSSDNWDLRLPETLPLRVELGGAMSHVALDLGSGRLERSDVEGVFMGMDLRLPRPARDTEVRVRGAFNALTLSVPEGTPVRVHGPGLPFNLVDRGVPGTGPGYDVQVQGVFTAATVETRPADGTLRSEPAPAARRTPAEAPPPAP